MIVSLALMINFAYDCIFFELDKKVFFNWSFYTEINASHAHTHNDTHFHNKYFTYGHNLNCFSDKINVANLKNEKKEKKLHCKNEIVDLNYFFSAICGHFIDKLQYEVLCVSYNLGQERKKLQRAKKSKC